MEGEVKSYGPAIGLLAGAVVLCGLFSTMNASGQDSGVNPSTRMSLRKSIQSREYRGQEIEGEERAIGRGDSLWRILVQEKGLPEKRFGSYLIVIRGLNPQLKDLNVLRVGDMLFIPLRPEEALGAQAASVKNPNTPRAGVKRGATVSYRIKSGDHLYQILRERLGIVDEKELAMYYALVKDLNPEKTDWDVLQEGETLRLPTVENEQDVAAAAPIKPAVRAKRPRAEGPPRESRPATEIQPPAAPVDQAALRRAPARQHMEVLAKVVEALGARVQSAGEEVISFKEGSVRIDKSSYPIVYHPKLGQKVVLDPKDKIPVALRAQLRDPGIGTPVISMTDGESLQDAVNQLLTGIGYQLLPNDRPVIVQDEGVAFEAHGGWMALGPMESNKPQQIYVVNLTDGRGRIPEYLRAQLALKGLHLEDVPIAAPDRSAPAQMKPAPREWTNKIRTWPRDKREIVDALLLACGVSFGVAEPVSVDLQDGLKLDLRGDRVFDVRGRRFVLMFQQTDAEIKKALEVKQNLSLVDLDLASLSSREIIGELLAILGDNAVYGEHRFPATTGKNQDRLIVSSWGFLLPKQSLFITDREIPQSLNRFFFEKGLDIAYFE